MVFTEALTNSKKIINNKKEPTNQTNSDLSTDLMGVRITDFVGYSYLKLTWTTCTPAHWIDETVATQLLIVVVLAVGVAPLITAT